MSFIICGTTKPINPMGPTKLILTPTQIEITISRSKFNLCTLKPFKNAVSFEISKSLIFDLFVYIVIYIITAIIKIIKGLVKPT